MKILRIKQKEIKYDAIMVVFPNISNEYVLGYMKNRIVKYEPQTSKFEVVVRASIPEYDILIQEHAEHIYGSALVREFEQFLNSNHEEFVQAGNGPVITKTEMEQLPTNAHFWWVVACPYPHIEVTWKNIKYQIPNLGLKHIVEEWQNLLNIKVEYSE